MANLIDILPFVMEECPGAPEPGVLRAIRSAAIEFSRETRIVVQYPDAIVLAKNTPDYDLGLSDAYKLIEIKEAWVDGLRINPASVATLGRFSDWQSWTSSKPDTVTQKSPEVVTVVPMPDGTASPAPQLTLRVVVSPSYDSTTFPDDLYDIYLDTIAAGARARLQMQPGKPWTNQPQAMVNNGTYQKGKNVARVRANRDGANELQVRLTRKV